MGKVDTKPFGDACLKNSASGDWATEASELCSSWQLILGDPNWHPFKNTVVDGKLQVTFRIFMLLLIHDEALAIIEYGKQ